MLDRICNKFSVLRLITESPYSNVLYTMSEVTTVAETFSNLRENFILYSKELYTEAVRLAESVGVEPTVPRLCGCQTKRANTPATSLEEYYKLSFVLPFMDHLINR